MFGKGSYSFILHFLHCRSLLCDSSARFQRIVKPGRITICSIFLPERVYQQGQLVSCCITGKLCHPGIGMLVCGVKFERFGSRSNSSTTCDLFLVVWINVHTQSTFWCYPPFPDMFSCSSVLPRQGEWCLLSLLCSEECSDVHTPSECDCPRSYVTSGVLRTGLSRHLLHAEKHVITYFEVLKCVEGLRQPRANTVAKRLLLTKPM